jgi:TetR/AcrR family acrAB operon transcriptional repressor
MARRTKVEAQGTRRAIIEAARTVFRRDGVVRAPLEKIALAAGLTRGAVYWHFKSKAEVFSAMKDEAMAVLRQMIDELVDEAHGIDPLTSIGNSLVRFFVLIEQDQRLREVLEIVTLHCESVDGFSKADFDPNALALYFRNGLVNAYQMAMNKGLLRRDLDPESLADDTATFFAGLLYSYLTSRLSGTGGAAVKHMISQHLDLRRCAPPLKNSSTLTLPTL